MDYDRICMGCMEEKRDAGECPFCGWVDKGEPESPQHLKPGTILYEKYLVGRALGQGGFGITYLGWDINLKRKLAIKEYMPQDLASRSEGNTRISVYTSRSHREQFEYGLEKFLQEAQTLAQFDGHPNIVSVRDFFRANDTAYIVMSYVEGITLKEYLALSGNKIEMDKALSIIMPVLDALAEVHVVNILHRDISPDNIFINNKGQITLIDFGAARQAVSEKGRSMSIILKPGFTPEEQYRSKGIQGPWTDIYAVAVTLYRMITGIMPPESLDRLADDTLLLPSQLGVEISEAEELALQKAMAIRAEDRFQSVREFQQALLGGSPGAHAASSGANKTAAPFSTQPPSSSSSPPPFAPPMGGEEPAPMKSESSVKSKTKKALRVAVFIAAGFGVLFIILVIAAMFNGDDDRATGNDLTDKTEVILSVPADYGTIQGAIDAAESGMVVVVDEGTYFENIDFRGKDIVLRSTDPEDSEVVSNTIINGDGEGPVISVRNGETDAAKVIGLHITGGSGVLETVVTEFEGEMTEVSEYVGGGILVMNGSALTIEKSLISGNDCIDLESVDDVSGGGIVIFGDSSAVITGNIISDNKSNNGGGIVVVYSSDAVIRGNTITETSAPDDPDSEFSAAGIFLLYNSKATIDNNRINDTKAPYLAGGIFVSNNSDATIRDNEIYSINGHYMGGGVIIAEDSVAQISKNEIYSNTADDISFGLFIIEKSTATIENNKIRDNSAGEFSSGISIGVESSAVIRDNTIERNNAILGLGIFIGENASATITGNNVSANRADSLGGGMYIMDNSTATASNNTIINNYGAEGGGGIIVLENSTLALSNNNFEDNHTDGIGGAILADKSSRLELDDPDSNIYSNNRPKNITIE